MFTNDEVLLELLSNSKKFSDFYQAERKRVSGAVNWHKCKLGENNPHVEESLVGPDRKIFIVNIPARVEDAIVVAHELCHAILNDESFPFLGLKESVSDHLKKDYARVGEQVMSMLTHHTINLMLEKYGFDLGREY